MAFLAIDAGTGSIRAVLFDHQGRQIAAQGREWVHLSDDRYPGSMDFDTRANFPIIVACIKEVLAHSGLSGKDIEAVSATSMREGFVVYDKAGKEIWACANVDSRASAEVVELRERDPDLEWMSYQISGQTFALSAQPRLLWLQKNEPELYDQAHSIGMISDWILTKLSGELSSEASNACSSGMFSLSQGEWSIDNARACGLREDLFPPVVSSGEIIGGISKEVAEQTGLKVGTAVVAGGGDAQLAALGLGVVSKGQVAIAGGSFWQVMVNIDTPSVDPDMRIRIDSHVVPNMWQAEGIAFNPGIAARWFRDAFGKLEVSEAQERGIDPYEILTEKAALVPPGSYGVTTILSDTMNYGRWIHAAPSFLNLSLDPEKSGPHVLFRSLLENAAIVSLSHLEVISSFTHAQPKEIVFAGGAAKSSLWAQIVADVLERPVHIPVVKEATALGAALCAAVGTGYFASLEEAGSAVAKIEKTLTPDSANATAYLEAYDRWQKSYPPQLELATQGVTTAMWRAPGI